MPGSDHHSDLGVSAATDAYALLGAFVDELARCGMRLACTSPGSRCAPLVLSLARERRIECCSHVDERCAGFYALGAAKASGRPVAVACTSGTAAAELGPAAIEAHEARVPLMLLTADRPPELRGNGAGQAIDQLKLYGSAAKWFVEVGVLEQASPARLRWIRTLACRAYWTALEGRPGVVHLNFPLREPLTTDERLPADGTGRANGLPYLLRTPISGPTTLAAGAPDSDAHSHAPANAALDATARLREIVSQARRGIVIAGRHERDTLLGGAATAFCEAAGWPLLADPLSGARRGRMAIAHYDALLREHTFAASHTPDVVLRVGDLPVSKPLRMWLSDMEGARQVALDPESAWQDPASALSDSFALEPAAALASIRPSPADPDWAASWQSADELAAEAILGVLATETISEPGVAAELGVLLPEEGTLFVASSMPVRDIETVWPAREDPPRVLCNRGASGIDGTVSSAFGAAGASKSPVVLLIGDVALAHDIGGLLCWRRLGVKLTIVLLDNDGGGIFEFLPVSRAAMARENEIYTRHVATPTSLDWAKAAGLYGLEYEHARTTAELRGALERAIAPRADSTIVHVRGERTGNARLHARMWHAVSAALNPPAGGAAPAA
jgi:2-succinyl-5-enolpyruvyl-6-hydroxy-3-cyclohexene-1-carboxylate synthase